MKNILKELRASQGLSQADLAQKVGVSRQAINAVENGKHDPSLALAFSIAETFNRNIERVFEPRA